MLSVGSRLGGRYGVVSNVGAGGMQRVYRATDFVLGRDVVVKTPISKSASKRFFRSAVLAARVNHHNVAKTYDYFHDGDSEYLVEEYVEGIDLQAFLTKFERRRIDPYFVAKIFHHLAKGVEASHIAGVVHRDLKPSNVLVSSELSLHEIKITDFGIAKMAADLIDAEADASGDEGAETQFSSTVLGALPFMAPENFDKSLRASFPADIWALGAIAYYLLTGKHPYGTGLNVVTSLASRQPLKRQEHAAEELQFKILSEMIFDVIVPCMAFDASERPTAAKLVETCSELCYQTIPRQLGAIKGVSNNKGFIVSEAGQDVFFHRKCVYGRMPKQGDSVCYAPHPSRSAPRAYPVLVLTNQ